MAHSLLSQLQCKSHKNYFWFFSINLQVVQYFTIVQKSTLLREEICEIYTNLYRLQTRFLRPFQNTEHNERFGGNEGRKGGCGAEGPLEALGAY